jgi:hypothetical protein
MEETFPKLHSVLVQAFNHAAELDMDRALTQEELKALVASIYDRVEDAIIEAVGEAIQPIAFPEG